MNHDYKKISTNWNKFLAEGAFNLNEDEKPNLVSKRITKPSKKGKVKIVDNILSKLPKSLQSKSMKAALAIGIRAVKDKEVSVKDVWSFVKAATNFATADDEESKALAKKQLDAEKVAQLPKVNVDVVFSGLLPVAKDSRSLPDAHTGSRVPAPTGGLASVRWTFEEGLDKDGTVRKLTEGPRGIITDETWNLLQEIYLALRTDKSNAAQLVKARVIKQVKKAKGMPDGYNKLVKHVSERYPGAFEAMAKKRGLPLGR